MLISGMARGIRNVVLLPSTPALIGLSRRWLTAPPRKCLADWHPEEEEMRAQNPRDSTKPS
jgi:hypothetical protein